jgi:hypothetical protein
LFFVNEKLAQLLMKALDPWDAMKVDLLLALCCAAPTQIPSTHKPVQPTAAKSGIFSRSIANELSHTHLNPAASYNSTTPPPILDLTH